MGAQKLITLVDYDKLVCELGRRGVNVADACVEMGYDKGYHFKIKASGKITLAFTKMLSAMYNINPSDYAPDNNTDKCCNEIVREIPTIDYEKLGEVIFNSVYEAVKKAWSE